MNRQPKADKSQKPKYQSYYLKKLKTQATNSKDDSTSLFETR